MPSEVHPPLGAPHAKSKSASPTHVLVLDDEETIRWVFQQTLRQQGFVVHPAASAEDAAVIMEHQPVGLALVDINLPGDDGLTFMTQQMKKHPGLLVAIITGQGTMDTAVKAMQMGAFDYLTKPFDINEVEELARRADQILKTTARGIQPPPVGASTEGGAVLIGKSRGVREVYKAIGRVASTGMTVLVLGESGTGKEMIARAIHHHAGTRSRPFVGVNCAAIPKDLLESELFGHERGAFTGATDRKLGRIEQARGGTLFLDEIGDMPLNLQAKLLRVLQEREYQRVGGQETLKVEARIVAATNQRLEKMVAEERFREDLLYRLNAFTLSIPPLRERREDIAPLTEYFLRKGAKELGVNPRVLTPEALQALEAYPWPGNVRELENLIKSLLITSAGAVIDRTDLPRNLTGEGVEDLSHGAFQQAVLAYWAPLSGAWCHQGKTGLLDQALQALEKPLIRQVLMDCGWNQVRAAQVLGVNRNTLRVKIKALGISRGDQPMQDEDDDHP